MCEISIALKRVVMLGLLAVALGCSREPPVAETPPVEVVVSQAAPPGKPKDKVEDWDTFTGTVEAPESVKIYSRVRGHIKKVSVKEGQEIAENAELFVIDSEPFKADLKQATGQLESWQAKLKFAEEKVAIYKPLAEAGTVAKEELANALGAKGDAIGGIATAKGKIQEAELNIGFCKITSPIAGRVGLAMLTKGNLVNASNTDLLTTIVSVDPMYVYFYVNERALLAYQKYTRDKAAKGPEAKDAKPGIPVEMELAGESSFPHKGVVDFLDNRVDPGTGSVKVRASFKNPKGTDDRRELMSGLFARVRVAVTKPYEAILVADRAILTDQSLKYVLVVNKDKKNVVERMDIVVSNRPQEDGRSVVLAGLKGDEWIIVEGVNRARPGVIVNPTEKEMPRRPIPK